MKVLFTFPGQDGQYPGMLTVIPDHKATFTQARAILGDEVATLDSTDALQHTRAVQLCLLITGVAQARELQRQGVDPQMVSGLSIGVLPVAVVAGALDFASALRLVILRDNLIEQAYPGGYGLTAIMGLTRPRVEALMQGHEVCLANLNAETQIAIAGRDEVMAKMAQSMLRAGASRAQRLTVSVPLHYALLDKPAAALAKTFADVTLTRPQCAYLSGSTAHVLWNPQRITDDLAMSMARTAHQQEVMIVAGERDTKLTVEMPPGRMFTCLTRQVD